MGSLNLIGLYLVINWIKIISPDFLRDLINDKFFRKSVKINQIFPEFS